MARDRTVCGTARGSEGRVAEIDVVLDTSLGSIEIAVDILRAPASACAFLALVDNGNFARHGTFYRTVRKSDNDHGSSKIDVIQGGARHLPEPLRGIEHEPTSRTGLRHVDGTVSLARGAIGSATGAAFFICIGDQPALDETGGRSRDGRGFAAFARVSGGMATVRAIHRASTSQFADDAYQRGQMLEPPIRISNAYRKLRGWRVQDA